MMRGAVSSPSQQASTPTPALPPLVVVVVAESRIRTRALRSLLFGPGFSVAAEACSAEAAEAAVVAHLPDAVLLDLAPELGGIEAIERIMGTRPTPIVVCGDMSPHAPDALAAGAVDVIGELDASPTSPQYASAVQRHIRVASRARVITHPRNRLRAHGLPANVRARPVAAPRAAVEVAVVPASGFRVIVIGASTGGPPALAAILADLPADLNVPVLVVQHMADGFVEALARWLDDTSPMPVVMATHARRLAPGTVHVAPAGMNAVLRRGLLVELRTPPAGQFHVPGVDASFTSAATVCGADAIGVLLTGMGRDGAIGLRKMRDQGALTIGQDEPTCAVWGMPAAAQALGAVERELPISGIAAAIVDAVRNGRVSDPPPAAGTCAPAAAR
jgi:two-component system, chemotaxis family, protein-glutamate methylesterase/glutaminase